MLKSIRTAPGELNQYDITCHSDERTNPAVISVHANSVVEALTALQKSGDYRATLVVEKLPSGEASLHFPYCLGGNWFARPIVKMRGAEQSFDADDIAFAAV